MFFPERITSIASKDLVLEVGPGGTPFRRADVYLEISPDPNDEIASLQRGNATPLSTDKPIIYFDGQRFPCADRAFDYVVCSHVLEHVENIESFLVELFRVAPRGYIEYPTIYYDYLYNFPVHLNFIKKKGETLLYLKKTDTTLSDFSPVHAFFFESLKNGHTELIDALREYLFEGFEYQESFACARAQSIEDLVWEQGTVRFQHKSRPQSPVVKRLLSLLMRGRRS